MTLGNIDELGPGCGHPSRFRTLAGDIACELCQRLRDGWADCPGCGRFEPLQADPIGELIGEEVRRCADCIGEDGDDGLW